MTLRTLIGTPALIVGCIVGCLAFAQQPDSHDYFSDADLDREGGTPPGRLFDHGNYYAAVAHREPGPGMSESHRDWADLYFISSGKATLIVGGSIVGGKETAPGEVRGTSIEGGTRRTLAEGDVVHIPAGTPHHVIVAAGEQLTYFLVKVEDGANVEDANAAH
jgi:mannose-6-phosphate isomerase-like protein (cupin superfamily)